MERTLLITANVSVLFWTLVLLLSIDNLISQLVTGMFTCTLCLMIVCVAVWYSGQCKWVLACLVRFYCI